jgi:S-adenosylmethionine:tRNA ribosyltransferase-isomerase
MELSDFHYQLPKHLIAQQPKEPRDSSRLMVVGKDKIEHRTFRDLVAYLDKGDVLVLNDSKVLPARLFGRKETGGKVEVLLIEKAQDNQWYCLIKGKNIRKDTQLIFSEDLKGVVSEKSVEGRYRVEFISDNKLEELIQEIGEMPIPPYIKESLEEKKRYQTIYAKRDGSIAAPTAGLHFTENLLNELEKKRHRDSKYNTSCEHWHFPACEKQ